MKVAAIARTKNEADIVEAFVRHTLGHVDKLYVQDNSEDETGEILAALVAEGLPLEVATENAVGDIQAAQATWLMKLVASEFDWVVPLDADEFPCGPEPLRETLARCDPNSVYIQRWRTYVFHKDLGTDWLPWTRMTYRLESEANPDWHKAIIPKSIALQPWAELPKGAHFVHGVAKLHDIGLHLAHFPIRSVEQWGLKALLHHAQEIAAGWKRPPSGNDHPAVIAMLERGTLDEGLLDTISKHYFAHPPPGWEPKPIHDPLAYKGGPLRYSKPVNLTRSLARFCEKMARELARTRGL